MKGIRLSRGGQHILILLCYHHTGTEAHLIIIIAYPNIFVHPTPSLRTKGIFRGSFSLRAQNTILDFWFCATSPVPNFSIISCEFCHEYCPEIAECFRSFSPAAKKSTPNPRHLWRQKSTPILKTILPSGFSGCSTLVCVAAFGCQYFCAD